MPPFVLSLYCNSNNYSMKNLLTLILSFFLMVGASNAQGISGTVVQSDGEAVAFANVVLRASADSSVAKVAYTEDDGKFYLRPSSTGDYFIDISYIGYDPYISETIAYDVTGDVDLGKLTLGAANTTLDAVTVKAKKPIVEVQPDKTRFNIEGSINAQGDNTLDLLRKAPGVVVDNNDNISLMGKNGVRIYINGRPSPLGGDDLAAYLRSLNASDISSIDIITNPSAKYEAQGNAGIIDIRLRKNQKHGTNATVNMGFAQGITLKGRGGINANYKNDNTNVFGSYGYFQGMRHNFANFYREQVGNIYEASNDIRVNQRNHNARLGADYFLDDKQTIGFLASTNLTRPDHSTRTVTKIS